MVFKSSITRFPESQCAIALLYFLWRMDEYSGLCLGRSRLFIPYPWRLDFILPLLFLNTGHSVTAIPACLCSPDGSAGHIVCFRFLYGWPFRGNI